MFSYLRIANPTSGRLLFADVCAVGERTSALAVVRLLVVDAQEPVQPGGERAVHISGLPHRAVDSAGAVAQGGQEPPFDQARRAVQGPDRVFTRVQGAGQLDCPFAY